MRLILTTTCGLLSLAAAVNAQDSGYRQRIGEINGFTGEGRTKEYSVPAERTLGEISSEKRLRESRAQEMQRKLKEKSEDLDELTRDINQNARRLEKLEKEYENKLKHFELLNDSTDRKDYIQRLGVTSDLGSYTKYFDGNGQKIVAKVKEERNNVMNLGTSLDTGLTNLASSQQQLESTTEEVSQLRSGAVGNIQGLASAQQRFKQQRGVVAQQQRQEQERRQQEAMQQYLAEQKAAEDAARDARVDAVMQDYYYRQSLGNTATESSDYSGSSEESGYDREALGAELNSVLNGMRFGSHD